MSGGKVQGYTARVSGHALRNEGRRSWFQSGSTWKAQCSCGATREVSSGGVAKRWHREHKAEVVAARTGDGA